MHVLHISSAQTWRGGEQQIAYLLRELTSMGIASTVMAPSGAPLLDYCEDLGIATVAYRKISSANIVLAWAIKRAAHNHAIDCIHIHDSHAHTYTYLSYKLARLTIPSVVSRRVDFAIKTVRKYDHPMVRRILCVSDTIREIVQSQINATDKVYTVHSGVDIAGIKATIGADLRVVLGVDQDTTIVGHIAALADHKDQETLLLSIRSYLDRYGASPAIHLVVVGGDAGSEAPLKRLVDQHGLAEHISMVGHQSSPHSWLKGMDLFVFSSKMEGLGTSVLDAMAAGVPIVSTRAGGLAELIIDRRTAVAVGIGDADAMADAIHLILSDDRLRSSIIEGAARWVTSFDKSLTARDTARHYAAATR